MTRFSALRCWDVNRLRQPLDKDAYRVLGIVGVLGTLFGAVFGFIVVPRWDVALACAILAIPGSLFAGGLAILLRRDKPATRRDVLRNASIIAIILVATGALVGLRHVIPSLVIRLTVIAVVAEVINIGVRVYRNNRRH